MMIEGAADFVSEEEMMGAINAGMEVLIFFFTPPFFTPPFILFLFSFFFFNFLVPRARHLGDLPYADKHMTHVSSSSYDTGDLR